MQARASDRPDRKRRIAVKEEDLEELYLLVQGAPYANSVLDARACLAQKDNEAAVKLLESARDRYRQSNKRILRQEVRATDEDPKDVQRQDRRLKQKQDRCNAVLEVFDDMVSILNRMIRLQAGGKRSTDVPTSSTQTVEELLKEGAPFRVEYETAHSTRVQLAVIRRYFEVQRVASRQDINASGLYYLRGKEHTYLIQVKNVAAEGDDLPVQLALSGQPMQPISRARFLEMGQRKRLVRLVPKGDEPIEASAEMQHVLEETISDDDKSNEVEILDIGTFTQLHDAARRSGLVANVDVIAHVRDREFRRCDYQKAFQGIEGAFGKFSVAASQRAQRLRREEVDIASGKLRMSTKELMAKRARDIAETQIVDRARNRFLRVLEGLRVLMQSD